MLCCQPVTPSSSDAVLSSLSSSDAVLSLQSSSDAVSSPGDTVLQRCCVVLTVLQRCCVVLTVLQLCCVVLTVLQLCCVVLTVLQRCCVVLTVLQRCCVPKRWFPVNQSSLVLTSSLTEWPAPRESSTGMAHRLLADSQIYSSTSYTDLYPTSLVPPPPPTPVCALKRIFLPSLHRLAQHSTLTT